MGNYLTSTHAKRSPSASFASPWQHELKRIVITAIILFSITFIAIQVIVKLTASKQITVVLNGEQIVLETRQALLGPFFEEHRITIGAHDRVSKRLDDKISDGDLITVDHTFPVHIVADGISSTMYTKGRTVQAALQDLNIPLARMDRTVPPPNMEIRPHQSIEVVRVQTVIEHVEQSLPFGTTSYEDHTLEKGKLKLVQEGRKGTLLKKVQQTYANGQLISENLVGTELVVNSLDEIVAVGTRNPVTILSASSPDIKNVSKDGMTFGVKKVLENVTLTAYDAGFNSTGKTEDHPQYGVTYTGTIVEEGRTIAVDPKVIPLGWWVYIEGVGLRKAEDIGSAIKGNIIDIYMESEEQANRFGRKRGHTVYIVGPQKPTAG